MLSDAGPNSPEEVQVQLAARKTALVLTRVE